MTDTFKRLAGIVPGTTFGALYTVPGATQTIIGHMKIINITNMPGKTPSPSQISIWHGTQVDANVMAAAITLQPGEFAEWDGRLEMSAAEVLNGLQTVSGVLVVQIHGLEIS